MHSPFLQVMYIYKIVLPSVKSENAKGQCPEFTCTNIEENERQHNNK